MSTRELPVTFSRKLICSKHVPNPDHWLYLYSIINFFLIHKGWYHISSHQTDGQLPAQKVHPSALLTSHWHRFTTTSGCSSGFTAARQKICTFELLYPIWQFWPLMKQRSKLGGCLLVVLWLLTVCKQFFFPAAVYTGRLRNVYK